MDDRRAKNPATLYQLVMDGLPLHRVAAAGGLSLKHFLHIYGSEIFQARLAHLRRRAMLRARMRRNGPENRYGQQGC